MKRKINRIIVSDSIIYLILDDRQGNEVARAIIDKEDYPKVLAVGKKFWMSKNKNKPYVLYANGFLHHIILGTKKLIDHINRNPLDNRRSNLRFCNNSQNAINSKKRTDNTSGFRGVFWYKRDKKWVVHIGIDSQIVHLGYFNNKIEAAKAYNLAAKKYHGKFARLNRISI